jgi:hypothetical protein
VDYGDGHGDGGWDRGTGRLVVVLFVSKVSIGSQAESKFGLCGLKILNTRGREVVIKDWAIPQVFCMYVNMHRNGQQKGWYAIENLVSTPATGNAWQWGTNHHSSNRGISTAGNSCQAPSTQAAAR